MRQKIAVNGMQFYAYHGFYEEENRIGGEYRLDVEATMPFKATDDDLAQTLNYEIIYNTAAAAMQTPVKLLETVAESINATLRQNYPNIEQLIVRIAKLNPPFGGQVDSAVVELTTLKTS